MENISWQHYRGDHTEKPRSNINNTGQLMTCPICFDDSFLTRFTTDVSYSDITARLP